MFARKHTLRDRNSHQEKEFVTNKFDAQSLFILREDVSLSSEATNLNGVIIKMF